MVIPLIVIFIAAFLSIVVTYLAIVEKDMLIAIVYLALLSIFYSLMYYALMAPDVVIAYIPISSVLFPIIMIIVIKKTKRYEE